MTINIEVQNKIAKRSDPKAFIVCGNSDYTIKFTFDEEWEEHEVKTARFYSNGEPEDVVFKGDECPVPVMERADGVFVGVFAGDLRTTTKAYIPCERSILCLGGRVKEPTPDVYAQLTQMINDGMIKGEQGFSIHYAYVDFAGMGVGDTKLVSFSAFKNAPNIGDLGITGDGILFEVTKLYIPDLNNMHNGGIDVRYLSCLKGEKGDKGDKGDAGAIKFIPVTRTDNENPIDDLPKENIDTSAIYLLPIDKADEQNRFTEYAYINGKWEILGAISIQVDHSEYVKFTDIATADKAGVVKVNQGNSGMRVLDGQLRLYPASPVAITLRPQSGVNYGETGPITLGNLNEAVIATLTDDKKIQMSEEQKTKACETIGAVAKQTQVLILYGTDANGKQTAWPLRNTNNTKNTIAGRDSNGNIQVGTAINKTDATNKEYVDDLIAELRTEIEALKNG